MLFKGDYDGLQSALGSGLFYLVDEKSVAPVYAIEKANGGEDGLPEEPYHVNMERQFRYTDKDRGAAY